jgi:hypothetical protein
MHIKVVSVQYNHYKLFWDQQDRWRIKIMHVKVASVTAATSCISA